MTKPPTDASLDAALALGGTRKATAAHPLCACVVNVPASRWDTGGRRITSATRRACPMHGLEADRG